MNSLVSRQNRQYLFLRKELAVSGLAGGEKIIKATPTKQDLGTSQGFFFLISDEHTRTFSTGVLPRVNRLCYVLINLAQAPVGFTDWNKKNNGGRTQLVKNHFNYSIVKVNY